MATELELIRKKFVPRVTQEDLARRAGMPLSSYRNAEKGRNVSYTTAKYILLAVNEVKRERGEDELGHVEDLGLSLV